MQSRDFCFWLQGYLEIDSAGTENTSSLTWQQVQIIKNHLNLVFKHEIDPSMPDPTGSLQGTHDGVGASGHLTVIPISDPNHPVNHSQDPLQNPNVLFRC